MKRPALVMLGALTAGCTTTTPAARVCDALLGQSFVGRDFSDRLGEDVRKATGSATMRVIRPGGVVTMDYRPDRLNVELNSDDKVGAVRCG